MKTSITYFTFITLVCVNLSFSLRAEDTLQPTKKNVFLKTSPIKNKFTVTASNSLNRGVYGPSSPSKDPLWIKLSNFRIEANYGLLSCLEVGAYFGYSDQGYRYTWTNGEFPTEHAFAINFGGQVNFHPLGLFLNQNRSRWDLWIGYKLGHSREYDKWFGRSTVENGWGFGFGYFPFKKQSLGFNFEYNTGNWALKRTVFTKAKRDRDFRWGVSYKFEIK
jgi:hypothetical protein